MISASKECSAKDKTEENEAKQDEVNDNQEVESSDKEMTSEEKDQESTLSKDDSECLAIEAAANRWKENDGWLPAKMIQTAVTHVYKNPLHQRTILNVWR